MREGYVLLEEGLECMYEKGMFCEGLAYIERPYFGRWEGMGWGGGVFHVTETDHMNHISSRLKPSPWSQGEKKQHHLEGQEPQIYIQYIYI